MVEILTEARAMELLREVVAERPDYVDPNASRGGCMYLEYDSDGGPVAPSCIVGHVLYRHGWTLDNLWSREITNPSQFEEIDVRAAMRLSVAQEAQDEGRTWATALMMAETYRHKSY